MEIVTTVLILVLVYMTSMYLLSMIIRRTDIVDIGWGLGFVLITLFLLNRSFIFTNKELAISILVTIWGLRLAIHILSRNIGKKEDFRYKKLKEDWGTNFWWKSYVNIFLLQGLLMLLISIPIIFSFYTTDYTFTWINYLGIFVWIVGFLFEIIGDLQLSIFISKKKKGETESRILKTGLWSKTRHPNYFGEVVLWWGVWLIAINPLNPMSLLTIIGPLTITILILFISGIPLLEKRYEGEKEWEEYKKKVPKFFPFKFK